MGKGTRLRGFRGRRPVGAVYEVLPKSAATPGWRLKAAPGDLTPALSMNREGRGEASQSRACTG
jgi:hypothetical protein